jgi:hypothetical protein
MDNLDDVYYIKRYILVFYYEPIRL